MKNRWPHCAEVDMKLLIDHKMINVCFHLITGTMAEQDLVALVKRLEAVALKLESSAGGAGGAGKSLLFNTVIIFTFFSSPGARTAAARVAFYVDCPVSVAVCSGQNRL